MKINKILSSLILVAVLALPVIALAGATPDVPVDTYTWIQVKAFITGVLYTVGGFVIGVMLLVSGILFVTASGDPEKVGKARNTLLYAVVGGVVLVLALSIWAIIKTWI
ncbi:MAG: hypothetical protein AAB361_03595 [Patescibacteria group bacterium]